MAVTVYDRHGSKIEYLNGARVDEGGYVPGDGDGVRDVHVHLRIFDVFGEEVGGFNTASWSHYAVTDTAKSFRGHAKYLADLAKVAKEDPTGVEALIERVFWMADQFAPGERL